MPMAARSQGSHIAPLPVLRCSSVNAWQADLREYPSLGQPGYVTFSPTTRRRTNFRLFCPDETNSNRLDDVFAVQNRCFVGPTLAIDDHISADGRVMEVLSEHLCEGWLEGYTSPGVMASMSPMKPLRWYPPP